MMDIDIKMFTDGESYKVEVEAKGSEEDCNEFYYKILKLYPNKTNIKEFKKDGK